MIIATSWETAEWVSRLGPEKGEQLYLIQHFEDWHASKERVLNTWRAIRRKIVISKWLGNIADQINEPYAYVPNGLDFSAIGMDVAPTERNPASILMLHHEQPFKGTAYGLKALERLREKRPDLVVTLFGAQPPEPESLPAWIHFVLRPAPQELRALYNAHAIFISPGLSEGWALPPAEAMQCGFATVLTDIGGHEYAVEGETSLLCSPKDPEKMAEKVLELIENPRLRITLGESAQKETAKYTWSRATDRLLESLIEPISNQFER